MVGNNAAASGTCELTVTPNPLRRLANQLGDLGPDFSVWRDIDELPEVPPGTDTVMGLPRNYRPQRKPSDEWTWFDCHRSIHWGLANLGVAPGPDFCRLLLPLADGMYGVMGAAAEVLDTSASDEPERVEPLLTILRERR